MKNKSERLPAFIKPEHYKITLTPNLDNFSFEGEEEITLINSKPSKTITLHSKDLKIESAEYTNFFKKEDLWSAKITYNETAETVTFTFPKTIPTGKGILKLVFQGILNENMRGFYRSKYELNGKEKFLATTQFESTDARRAFPCFDEPSHKAIFEVSLIVPPGFYVVSNTIETSVKKHESGHQIFEFSPTPKMSTYLLAFIVGELEKIETKTKSGVKVRVFVTPGKTKQAEFALEMAKKTLEFYEEYFDIPYPLPTLDMIAIPDFSSGAMENWGAVTYRETTILVDPENTSTANKQYVSLVIAHELAHQWFGNLVTMKWWTHLWLNEGFASFIEYLAVNHLFPDWDIWTQFIYADFNYALSLDSLENTHPIEVEVKHPDEISEIFDAVSYSKGSSVLRMLESWIGPKNFRDGLRLYLKTHQYENAETEDLWKALEKVSKMPVSKVMKNWTSKPGYPYILVMEQGKNLKLTQQRFFSSSTSLKNIADKTLWQIPINIIQDTQKVTTLLLDKKSIKIPQTNSWVKINSNETSFFRTKYQESYLHLLEKPISDKQISAVDRVGLIRDSFDLAESGISSVASGLILSLSYQNEDDYTVWSELSSSLKRVYRLIEDDPKLTNSFKNYALNLFQNIFEKLGWDKKPGEKHTDSLLRILVLSNLGEYGNPKVINKSQDLFYKTISKKIKLEPDLRGIVYSVVAKNGGAKEYEQLLNLYKHSSLQEEKNRIAASLTQFKQTSLIKKTLHFAFSKEVRPQDAFRIISYAFTNKEAKEHAWVFVKENWAKILERYGAGGHILPRFIQPAAVFYTTKKAKDIKTFFKKNQAPGAERTIAQTIEKINSNADFLKRDKTAIKKFLENY